MGPLLLFLKLSIKGYHILTWIRDALKSEEHWWPERRKGREAQQVKNSAETREKSKYFYNPNGVVDTVLSGLCSYITGNSFNAMKEELWLFPFYIQGNWGTENLNNLSKVTPPINGRAGMQIKASKPFFSNTSQEFPRHGAQDMEISIVLEGGEQHNVSPPSWTSWERDPRSLGDLDKPKGLIAELHLNEGGRGLPWWSSG